MGLRRRGHGAPFVVRLERCCHEDVARPRAAIATRKIALATTFTCGGTATRATPQTNSGNVVLGAGIEVRDHEVVDGEGEAEQRGAQDRGREQRQRDLAERRPLVRAEVHRRLLEVAVEADQPRLHRDDDVADDEHHVRDEDRHEAEVEAPVMLRKSVSSEAPSTISGVDIGRKTSRFVAPRPRKSCRTIADRHQRSEHRREDRREQRDLERRRRPRRGSRARRPS